MRENISKTTAAAAAAVAARVHKSNRSSSSIGSSQVARVHTGSCGSFRNTSRNSSSRGRMEAEDIANHYAAVAKHYQVGRVSTVNKYFANNFAKSSKMQGVVYSNPSDREYQEEVALLCKKYLDLQPHHHLVDLAGG